MWSGDFIGNRLLSRGNDFTALNRSFFSPCRRRRLVDGGPKNAELFDRPHKVDEIHRLDHVGVDAVLIKLDQIRRFARGSERYDRNYFQMLVGLDGLEYFQPTDLRHLVVEQHDNGIAARAHFEFPPAMEIIRSEEHTSE